MVVQLWWEAEPFAVHIIPVDGITWTLPPLYLMIYLSHKLLPPLPPYMIKKGSKIINSCQLYLQITSTYDLLFDDSSTIHPSFLTGEQPPSWQPQIVWPDNPSPPKHYWKLWNHFLHHHVTAYLNKVSMAQSLTSIRYSFILFKHHFTSHLYRFMDDQMTWFPIQVTSHMGLRP